MSVKLRDFIRSVRASRTAAEERSVVAKECALIRTAFKEGDTSHRHRNVAKLLFIHMMGYPTHFGQMECLRLIASSRFIEKRIGYLGLMQFMDKDADLLMMVTNSIKNDLQHTNQFVNGLALVALSTVGTPDMCQTLAKEVETLCSSGNPYIKKKAVLCAARLVRRAEECSPRFSALIPHLLEENNHGVLLSSCALLRALLETNGSVYRQSFSNVSSQTVVVLKRISMMSGYFNAAEYDVGGVADPFLQVALIRVIRLLHENDVEPNAAVTDILAQVVSAAEGNRAAGNSVLLEAISTIFHIPHDAALRSTGINTLGKFFQNRDNTLRYAALCLLQYLIKIDPSAMQPHRRMIIECLRSVDIAIRRRALDVTYTLINASAIKPLFKELLGLLLDAGAPGTSGEGASLSGSSYEEQEFRIELVSKMCKAVQRFAPTRRWLLDSLIRIFSLASDVLTSEDRNRLIFLVVYSPELQRYAVLKLLHSAKENLSQAVLLQAALWVVGEFSHLLVAPQPTTTDNPAISESEVLDFMDLCVKRLAPCSSPTKDAHQPFPVTSTNRSSAPAVFDIFEELESGITPVNDVSQAPPLHTEEGALSRDTMATSMLRSEASLAAPVAGLVIGTSPLMTLGTASFFSSGVGEESNSSTNVENLLSPFSAMTESSGKILLNALIKLSTRFSAASKTRIDSLLSKFLQSPSIELEQRTVEYRALLQGGWDPHRSTIFDVMPWLSGELQTRPDLQEMLNRPIGETSDQGLAPTLTSGSQSTRDADLLFNTDATPETGGGMNALLAPFFPGPESSGLSADMAPTVSLGNSATKEGTGTGGGSGLMMMMGEKQEQENLAFDKGFLGGADMALPNVALEWSENDQARSASGTVEGASFSKTRNEGLLLEDIFAPALQLKPEVQIQSFSGYVPTASPVVSHTSDVFAFSTNFVQQPSQQPLDACQPDISSSVPQSWGVTAASADKDLEDLSGLFTVSSSSNPQLAPAGNGRGTSSPNWNWTEEVTKAGALLKPVEEEKTGEPLAASCENAPVLQSQNSEHVDRVFKTLDLIDSLI